MLTCPALALAEGSAELDVGDVTGVHQANDQAVSMVTVLRADVVDASGEKICWQGSGTLTVSRPDNGATLDSLATGECVATPAGVTGAFPLLLSRSQVRGVRWDVRVCGASTSDSTCLSDAGAEQKGRLWSTEWQFLENAGQYTSDLSVNGSVYALVSGGAPARDAVVELHMRGLSGASYELRANSTGTLTTAGERVGRSVPDAGHTMRAEYRMYLSPPALAQYNWIHPEVTNATLAPTCGAGLLLGGAAASVRFASNAEGSYRFICDADKDGSYAFGAATDYSALGSAINGTSTVTWNGKNNAGANVPPGDYRCVVRVNVGEFHYVPHDVETAYPGIRMFRVESDKATRTAIAMFWDDREIAPDTEPMNNVPGQFSPDFPPALGLLPGSYGAASEPYYLSGTTPSGNARAWGNFNLTSKGNDAFLDQFAAADTAQSEALTISVMLDTGDADADGLTNARECTIGTNPLDNDTDKDGVGDGFEATATTTPNSDGDALIDALDNDDDGDGVVTSVELGPKENRDGNPDDAANSDGKGASDYLEVDSDADGVPDATDSARTNPSRCRDVDGDLCDDCSITGANGSGGDPKNDGTDSDGDGACDDGPKDDDGDGVPNGLDTAPLEAEECADKDDDLCDDCAVTGADGSGGDPNNDGSDLDGDGLCDLSDPVGVTEPEAPDADTDGDGLNDAEDLDDDGDGILDGDEVRLDPSANANRDGDRLPNPLDLDADDDGILDRDEAGNARGRDANRDGRVDGEVGENGVADSVETAPDSGKVALPVDTDGDGLPDFLDPDSDDDGVSDLLEAGDDDPRTPPVDTDRDGIPDFQDPDDDSDGIPSADERGDLNKNGVQDRLEATATGSLSGGARCSASQGAPTGRSLALFSLGLLSAFVLRRGRRRRLAGAAAALSLGSLAVSEHAEAQVALDQFRPAPLVRDGFALARPDVLAPWTYSAQLLLDYANDPLVYMYKHPATSSEEKVVSDHLVGHVAFGYGLGSRLTVFGTLPIHILMDGKDSPRVSAPRADGAGLGDAALGGRVRLLGDVQSAFALSFDFTARLPTAELARSRQAYSGDKIGSYEPTLNAEARLGKVALRALVGARLRKEVEIGNLTMGQEALGGLGARLQLSERVDLHAEVYGATVVQDAFKKHYVSLEALGGAKYHGQRLHAGLAAGPGLTRGYGSPDVRVVGMLGVASPMAGDRDQDGVPDSADTCPDAPEDKDGHQDNDGCPDPDNDGDAVLDAQDRCVNDPEDQDKFEDTDGCPDPDNDGDGLLDSQDRCPDGAEDKDGFEDADGCPDPDNDGDGILDGTDACPSEAEDKDGKDDADGCPDPDAPVVKLTCDRIEIGEAVYFDNDRDVIQERSFGLLDQIAALLAKNPQVKRLLVEGHTDDRGQPGHNLQLSKRRAKAVLTYLTNHGVESPRLRSEGRGKQKPIADNATPEGRDKNRRVEFRVEEQEGNCAGK
jgi:outer membrane protein OmpA-like peptidoglycan-associated protein